MKKMIFLASCGLLMGMTAFAQEDKLTITPSGRILMDAGVMHDNNEGMNSELKSGTAIPDVRLGFKAKYGQWNAKAELSYSRGLVSMKDIFVEYDFNKNNLLRGGYFVHQFGLQSATSSSFKISMEEPESQSALGNGRLLGLMYQHDDAKFHATASLYNNADAMKKSTDQTGNNGWGSMTRLVYRPFTERGRIFHVGISASYEVPTYNKVNGTHTFSFVSNYPTRIAQVKVVDAEVTNSRSFFKISPEMTGAYGHLGIEAQYYYLNVDRRGTLPDYHAWGAYGNLRFLLNSEYTYTMGDAGIATPDPKSWEIVAAYNYTDLTDKDILGGKVSDWALTMNYYINKYMIWRISGHVVKASDNASFANNNYNILETRLQIKF
jgi:phosphate-selective porin OprO/OprP